MMLTKAGTLYIVQKFFSSSRLPYHCPIHTANQKVS